MVKKNLTRLRDLDSPEAKIWQMAAQKSFPEQRLQNNFEQLEAKIAHLSGAVLSGGSASAFISKSGTKLLSSLASKKFIAFLFMLGAILSGSAVLLNTTDRSDSAPETQTPGVKIAKVKVTEDIVNELQTPEVQKLADKPPSQTQTKPSSKIVSKNIEDSGTLHLEVQLYRAAEQLRETNPQKCLRLLDQLESKFPQHRLRAEADLTRAHALVLANRNAEALPLIQKMLKQTEHAGRSAELFQLLGDVWVHLGQCERAEKAYKNALEPGVFTNISDKNKASDRIHAAILNCQHPKRK